MKRALKLTLSALAAAVIAAPASASVIDNLAVTGALTYTEASGNGLHFAHYLTAQNVGQQWRPVFVEPDHEFDYSASLSYRIDGHNTRVFFAYDHFKDDESRFISGSGVAALNQQAPNNGNVLEAESNVQHKERDFKIGLRHTLNFGPKFETDLAGGLEWNKVQRTQDIQARFYVGAVRNVRSLEVFNESEGWGPFVEGTGRAYPWGDANRCWSFWMRGGFALLYADHTTTITSLQSQGGGVATFLNGNSLIPEDTKSILVKVEADMGVEWNRVMRADFNDLMLGIKLGVRYHNTASAFKNTNTLLFTGAAGGLNRQQDVDTRDNDFGRMGPFLEFKLGGANS